MRLSTRYGLVAIAALALLTAVDGLRGSAIAFPPFARMLLGAGPNFAAAIAIAFVGLCIWVESLPGPRPPLRVRFIICLTVGGLGLVAWEFVQRSSRSLVFDPGDLIATALGCALAAAVFAAITPRA